MRIFIILVFPFLIYFSPTKVSDSHFISLRDTLTSTDSILQFWLNKVGVDDDKPIFKTFYFWTTEEELDSVETQHLLIRSQENNPYQLHFYNNYRKALSNKKWNENPIASNLREGKFGRSRSAWPCYWSGNKFDTLYFGVNQLVKVELEDSALIVVFRPTQKNVWEVFDLNGRLIPIPEFEKRINQIAAVYYSEFVKVKVAPNQCYDSPPHDYYNRTFFLCNEKMIKGWHHAVPGMQKQILDDLNYLLLLDAYLGSDVKKTLGPGKNGKNVVGSWTGSSKHFSIAQYFFRTQCFASSEYPEAFPFAIDQIIGTLRYRWPKQVHPMERFPSREIR